MGLCSSEIWFIPLVSASLLALSVLFSMVGHVMMCLPWAILCVVNLAQAVLLLAVTTS